MIPTDAKRLLDVFMGPLSRQDPLGYTIALQTIADDESVGWTIRLEAAEMWNRLQRGWQGIRVTDLYAPDGDQLRGVFVKQWLHERHTRLRHYMELGDIERAAVEAQAIADALHRRSIPQDVLDIPGWDFHDVPEKA